MSTRSIAKPAPTYPFQFNLYVGELLEQLARYKLYVIDKAIKLEKLQIHLDTTKGEIGKLGLPEPFKSSLIERDQAEINVAQGTIILQREEILSRIEPLLEKTLSFFPDILSDNIDNELSKSQFKTYLLHCKHLLHYANGFGLACDGKNPLIALINTSIERHL